MASNRIKTDALDQYFEHGVYTPGRLLDLSGEIDEEKATKFIKGIRLLDHVGDEDIRVLINSPGGEVHQGLAIVDSIKECQSRVITHAVGAAWSMAGIILQAGDERIVSDNATLMIHIGSEGYDEDHPLNVERWQKEYKRIEKINEDILFEAIKKKHPRFTRKKLKELLIFDTIYTAKQSIDMGLADKIEEHKTYD